MHRPLDTPAHLAMPYKAYLARMTPENLIIELKHWMFRCYELEKALKLEQEANRTGRRNDDLSER